MTWVCDKCYSEMEFEHIERNYNRVHCPTCGEEWYVDDKEEYINEPYSSEDDESLSVDDAASIWLSHGKDDDYMFGYSEDELEDALR